MGRYASSSGAVFTKDPTQRTRFRRRVVRLTPRRWSVPGGRPLDEVPHAGRVHLRVDAREPRSGAPEASAHYPDLIALTLHRVEQSAPGVALAGVLAFLARRNHGSRIVQPAVGLP